MRKRKPRSGFTLVEVTISIAIMGTLMSVYLTTINDSLSTQERSQAEYALRSRTLKALTEMQDELQRAGFVTSNDDVYPALYTAAEIGGTFPVLDHTKPYALYDGVENPDTPVPNSDIVFVLPQDANRDGWPDLTSDGTPDWGVAYYSYVLSPGLNGTNNLNRVTSTGSSTIIARGVQYVEFDTPVSSAYEVPLGCIRIRISVIEKEGGLTLDTYKHEVTVRLRNGGLL